MTLVNAMFLVYVVSVLSFGSTTDSSTIFTDFALWNRSPHFGKLFVFDSSRLLCNLPLRTSLETVSSVKTCELKSNSKESIKKPKHQFHQKINAKMRTPRNDLCHTNTFFVLHNVCSFGIDLDAMRELGFELPMRIRISVPEALNNLLPTVIENCSWLVVLGHVIYFRPVFLFRIQCRLEWCK